MKFDILVGYISIIAPHKNEQKNHKRQNNLGGEEVRQMKAKLIKVLLAITALLLAGGANFHWGG